MSAGIDRESLKKDYVIRLNHISLPRPISARLHMTTEWEAIMSFMEIIKQCGYANNSSIWMEMIVLLEIKAVEMVGNL